MCRLEKGPEFAPEVEHQRPPLQTLDQAAAGRASGSDANHLLYLVKANQLAAADPAKIRTPALVIYAPTDLVFPAPWLERTVAALRAAGAPVDRKRLSKLRR